VTTLVDHCQLWQLPAVISRRMIVA